MSTKDINKTNVRRNLSKKRRRNRRRGLPMLAYVIIILVLIVALVVTLCTTFLFNIDKFIVEGDIEEYTPEQIVKASGIENKDNMFRLDTEKAEQNIVNKLVYIETAKITRQWPHKLEISVTRCKKAYNLEVDGSYFVVSEAGKILSTEPQPDTSLVTYKGFDPQTTQQGTIMKSKDSQKNDIFKLTSEVVDSGLKYPIDSIDMTNKYSISVGIDGRITFFAGSWTDMDYKIKLAEKALESLDTSTKGIMTMIGDNQISFRTQENAEESRRRENTNKDALEKAETEDTSESDGNEENNDNNNEYVED